MQESQPRLLPADLLISFLLMHGSILDDPWCRNRNSGADALACVDQSLRLEAPRLAGVHGGSPLEGRRHGAGAQGVRNAGRSVFLAGGTSLPRRVPAIHPVP